MGIVLEQPKNLCTIEDEFILENPQWIADLSNGVRIYQDDYREGLSPPSAWQRLKQYLYENNLTIKNFRVRNRSHWENPVPADAYAYYFGRCATAYVGRPTNESYVIGHLDLTAGQFYVQYICVPELILWDKDWRPSTEVKPNNVIFRSRLEELNWFAENKNTDL